MAPADVVAVLRSLSDAIVKYLAEDRSVQLDGIGRFYLTATAKGNGVDTADEVSPQQINKVMVRFLAEKVSSMGGIKASVPTLAATQIKWQRIDAAASGTSGTLTPTDPPSGGSTGGGSGEGDEG